MSGGERWARVRELLGAAIERKPEERRAFLEAACAGDADLWAEVTSLLEAYERTGRADRVAADVLDPLRRRWQRAPGEGDRIGPYRVLRRLGRGGMGAVYLAERADREFERRVALKLVPFSLEGDELDRRFLNERRILAQLDHPNIARLLDGGRTADGLPYLIMEYVDGTRVDSYADERRLSVRERLRLFLSICDAVQYAHQNLVVHRDLKPSNILVAADGTVKLLDFGIAKLLAEVATEDATASTGTRWMTPSHASPEQVRGRPITTATDTYALGVLLYELLSGHRPYDVSSGSASEIERLICESQPARPSIVVGRVEEHRTTDGALEHITADAVARARSTDPGRVSRMLAGDLDTIVLRALSKPPERRYATAGELAEDVRRHLAGMPVQARPDTLRYRAAKFVRRHRVGVTAAALVALALLGGAAGTAWQARRATLQARVATEERDRARVEALKAEQVSTFLVDLFRLSDPRAARGEAIAARELLDSAAARIDQDLAQQPDVRADLMDVMAQIYLNLGLYQPAEDLFTEALDVRRNLHGEDHADVAASLNNLGLLYQTMGDYARAESLYSRTLAIRRRLNQEEHPTFASNLNNLALLLQIGGKYTAAESLYTEALALTRRTLGDRSLEAAKQLNNLGSLKRMRGDLAGAEPLLREALALKREILGDQNASTANSMNQLAVVLQARGDHAAAEALYRETLEIRRRLFGPDHPELAIVLNDLGSLQQAQGRHRLAESTFRQALAIFATRLGASHPHTAVVTGNVGSSLHAQGRIDAAEPLYVRAIDGIRTAWSRVHPRAAEPLIGLGVLYLQRGEPDRAAPLLREALEIRQRHVASGGPKLAQAEMALAVCLSAQGRLEEAESLLRSAREANRVEWGAGNAWIWNVLDDLLESHAEARVTRDPPA